MTLAHDLVEIPSHESETRAGDYVETWLRAHTDATVERDPHGNVIARCRATGGSDTRLALVGHHDVVPPDQSQVTGESYVVERRDGRGAADMKAAVAAAMPAFRDTDRPGLVFASFAVEEVGGRGARAAIADGFTPDYAVVGEGSTGFRARGDRRRYRPQGSPGEHTRGRVACCTRE